MDLAHIQSVLTDSRPCRVGSPAVIDCHDQEPNGNRRKAARRHRNTSCRMFDHQSAGGQPDTSALVGQPDTSALVGDFWIAGSESNDVANDRN
jgi:hypothetical protein